MVPELRHCKKLTARGTVENGKLKVFNREYHEIQNVTNISQIYPHLVELSEFEKFASSLAVTPWTTMLYLCMKIICKPCLGPSM